MLYVALTFWLLTSVFLAWGVRRLWTGLVPPKVLNGVLLPGTLIGVLGHVLGLLITGATVNNTTLYRDDGSGDPETTVHPKPRIPILGHIVIGLLPLLACGAGIFFLTRYLGGPLLVRLQPNMVSPRLPSTLSEVWQFIRDQVTLTERLVEAARAADFRDWKTGAFSYLLICLVVRIAPFPGNLRGALGAIITLGVASAAVASLFDAADPRIQSAWDVLNLTVASLLFLLLASLVLRGLIGLVKLIHQNA